MFAVMDGFSLAILIISLIAALLIGRLLRAWCGLTQMEMIGRRRAVILVGVLIATAIAAVLRLQIIADL
jgi:hypothetical protein